MRLGYDFQHQCLGKFHLQVAVTGNCLHGGKQQQLADIMQQAGAIGLSAIAK